MPRLRFTGFSPGEGPITVAADDGVRQAQQTVTWPDAAALALSLAKAGRWSLTADSGTAIDILAGASRNTGLDLSGSVVVLANPKVKGLRGAGSTLTASDQGCFIVPTGATEGRVWQRSTDNGGTWTTIASDAGSYVLTVADEGSLVSFARTVNGSVVARSNTLEIPAAGTMCQRPVLADGRQWLKRFAGLGVGTSNDLMLVMDWSPLVEGTGRDDHTKILCLGEDSREGLYYHGAHTGLDQTATWFQFRGASKGWNNYASATGASSRVPDIGARGVTIWRIQPEGGGTRLTTAGRTAPDLTSPLGAWDYTTKLEGDPHVVLNGDITTLFAESYRGDMHPWSGYIWRMAFWEGSQSGAPLPTDLHTSGAAFDLLIDPNDNMRSVHRFSPRMGDPLWDIGGGGAQEFNAGVNHGSFGAFDLSSGEFSDAVV